MLVVIWMTVGPSSRADEPATLGLPGDTSTSAPLALPTTSASGAAGTPGGVSKALQAALGKSGSAGSLSMPGLPGGTLYKNLPRHHIVLTVTSEVPVGTVGYIVPTSLRKNYGVDKNVGTSWQLVTTAYGDPDYAQLFVQAGARGYPVRCRITVDGRVTAERSTDGPYGQMMCQG